VSVSYRIGSTGLHTQNDKQHYYTGSVKNLQSKDIHDNYTNIPGNYTITQTPTPLRK
jgi:hypothetical protein